MTFSYTASHCLLTMHDEIILRDPSVHAVSLEHRRRKLLYHHVTTTITQLQIALQETRNVYILEHIIQTCCL
jgi:hypothetical protein